MISATSLPTEKTSIDRLEPGLSNFFFHLRVPFNSIQCHYSSGPKEKGLRQKLRIFLRINRKSKKKVFARNSGLERPQKKCFRQGIRIIWAIYCCILITEKRKKVVGRMTMKGCRPGKMPWRAASGSRAVAYRPLLYSVQQTGGSLSRKQQGHFTVSLTNT